MRLAPIKLLLAVLSSVGPIVSANAQVTHWHSQALSGQNMSSVWASGPHDVFVAGGTNSINHFDGSTWTAQPNSFGFNRYHLFGSAPNDVFVTGQSSYQAGALGHYNGSVWSEVLTTSDELTAGHEFSPNAVFVGGDGTLRKYDGSSWSDISTGLSKAFNTDRLTDIWGASESDFFVVGYHGIFMHYDGSVLSQVSLGGTPFFRAIQGKSGSDLFAVGDNGAIWHDDGSTWSPMASGTTATLTGVYELAPNDVYASGNGGTMLHYNGTTWKSLNVGTTDDITDVWAVSPKRVFASAGRAGEVFIGEGSPVVTPEPASLVLMATGLAGIGMMRRRKAAR